MDFRLQCWRCQCWIVLCVENSLPRGTTLDNTGEFTPGNDRSPAPSVERVSSRRRTCRSTWAATVRRGRLQGRYSGWATPWRIQKTRKWRRSRTTSWSKSTSDQTTTTTRVPSHAIHSKPSLPKYWHWWYYILSYYLMLTRYSIFSQSYHFFQINVIEACKNLNQYKYDIQPRCTTDHSLLVHMHLITSTLLFKLSSSLLGDLA